MDKKSSNIAKKKKTPSFKTEQKKVLKGILKYRKEDCSAQTSCLDSSHSPQAKTRTSKKRHPKSTKSTNPPDGPSLVQISPNSTQTEKRVIFTDKRSSRPPQVKVRPLKKKQLKNSKSTKTTRNPEKEYNSQACVIESDTATTCKEAKKLKSTAMDSNQDQSCFAPDGSSSRPRTDQEDQVQNGSDAQGAAKSTQTAETQTVKLNYDVIDCVNGLGESQNRKPAAAIKILKSPLFLNRSSVNKILGSQSTPRKVRKTHHINSLKNDWGTPKTSFYYRRVCSLQHNVVAGKTADKTSVSKDKIDLIPAAVVTPVNFNALKKYTSNQKEMMLTNSPHSEMETGIRVRVTETYEITPVKSLIQRFEEMKKADQQKAMQEKTTIKIIRSSFGEQPSPGVQVVTTKLSKEITSKSKSDVRGSVELNTASANLRKRKFSHTELKVDPNSNNKPYDNTNQFRNEDITKQFKLIHDDIISRGLNKSVAESETVEKQDGTNYRTNYQLSIPQPSLTHQKDDRQEQKCEYKAETTQKTYHVADSSDEHENVTFLSYFSIPTSRLTMSCKDLTTEQETVYQNTERSGSNKSNNNRSTSEPKNYFIKVYEEDDDAFSFENHDKNEADSSSKVSENNGFLLKNEDFPPLLPPDENTVYIV